MLSKNMSPTHYSTALVVLALTLTIVLSACDGSWAYTLSSTSVTGNGSMSASQVDKVLCDAASPACGTGPSLYNYAQKYSIKPSFALAVFRQESKFGTLGIAKVTRSLGNIRCAGWPACIKGFRAYASWPAGYTDFFKLIKTQYVDTWHCTTVTTILEKYAPPAENDTSGYASHVSQWMDIYDNGRES